MIGSEVISVKGTDTTRPTAIRQQPCAGVYAASWFVMETADLGGSMIAGSGDALYPDQ